jgi:hypothetical protein
MHNAPTYVQAAPPMSTDDELLLAITRGTIDEFCESNDEPILSDEEIGGLICELDSFLYPWIGEALFTFRERRCSATVQIGPLDTEDTIYLHNDIARLMGIQMPVVFIDGNTLNNQRENLRSATIDDFANESFDDCGYAARNV